VTAIRQILSFALAIVFPLVAAAEPLKQEPAVASMATGSIVYVDDGTCPAAQIKKVVIGSNAQNIPRVRSCISLDTMRAEEVAASAVAPFDGKWLAQTNRCFPAGAGYRVGADLQVKAGKFTLNSTASDRTNIICVIKIQPDGTFSNQTCDLAVSGQIKGDIMELHNTISGGGGFCDKTYKRASK
jgi:hypothetical protein